MAGSDTSRVRRRCPRSTRTSGASRCTRCRRSRAREGRSSSTAPGPRSRPRRTRRRGQALELARTLGLEPFELDDADRPLYHAGAAMASNFLVTLHEAAASLVAAAGAPPEALEPLMRRTIENGFELTGPIVRGDWATRGGAPRGDPRDATRPRAALRRARGGDGSMKVARSAAELPRRGRDRPRPDDGRLPRRPPRALPRRARGERARRREPVRQPGPVRRRRGPGALPARRGARRRARRGGRRRRALRPRAPRRSTRRASRPGSRSSGSARCSRASTGPATSAASRPSA